MAEEVKEAVKEEGAFKMKKKRPKKLTKKDKPFKVDLSKKETKEDAVQESSTESVDVQELPSDGKEVGEVHIKEQVITPTSEEKKEEVVPEKQEEKVTVIQEITNEEKQEEVVSEIKEELKADPQLELPENIEKLVDFMKETGGTIDDYTRLNADYTNVDGNTLLREYYKQTKPHLDLDEISFMMDDSFAYDEDMDEERDIRKKKLAMKEEVAKARNFLDGLKSKYYEEIKLRPGVTQEQQKATDFFNRYNEEQKVAKTQHEAFKNTTKDYFTGDFKGFEFNLGEKRFRYGVNNATDIANEQSDISTFVKKFLNEDGSVKDYKGYHKAIYAARNADTIANHFYEQGKADAVRDINARSKNINNEPRASASGDIFIDGFKVKAISGVDSSKLKIKKRKFNT